MLILVLVPLILWLALQTSPIQNWLVGKATSFLSKEWKTNVKIDHIDVKFFNKLDLKGTLIEDQQKDTLLYAGSLVVSVNDWFFLEDKIELKYVGLSQAQVSLHRTDSIWNYQFIVDYFGGGSKASAKKKIQLDIQTIQLEEISLFQRDEWRGENLGVQLKKLTLLGDDIDLDKKKIHLVKLQVDGPLFTIYNYPGRRPARAKKPATPYVPVPGQLRWNVDNWDISIDQFQIRDGMFKSDVMTDRAPYPYFDGNHMQFNRIQGKFDQLRIYRDTISCNLTMSTEERCGFTVNELKARLKFQPTSMEFHQLVIQTPNSRLTDFFAMRYQSFNDMSDFLAKVTVEGNLTDALLHSDDIAYFAPELKDWKKKIKANGQIRGTIENLTGKNLRLESGTSASLTGDLVLKGLPDIDNTSIVFERGSFYVSYADATKLIPSLGKIKEPNLQALQYIRFNGGLSGKLRNLTTNGRFQTAMGSIATQVNLQLPNGAEPSYAGTIQTDQFDLGTFLGEDMIQKISFEGKIKGRGTSLATLQADLDGQIRGIGFKGYDYKNISVKGHVSNKKFNGDIRINDPHAVAQLQGLIDLSGKMNRFNINAFVSEANLQLLKLTNRDIDVTGNLIANFTGNNIDQFLGEAGIFNASIFKDGQRVSFDSLTLTSAQEGNQKKLIVRSNELDAVIAGQFKILDLPNGFQAFLNRYYPSYIRPLKTKIPEQDFSFLINTRKIDDYLDLFDENIRGLNNASIEGQINSANAIFQLEANIPQFAYRNASFYDLQFKGEGNYDSLKIESKLTDLYFNDSLHFPDTQLRLTSSNDITDVNLFTTVNRSSDSALLQARVQTLKNGVSILFQPSVFDINGKRWSIDNDGEIILSKELVTTNGLRIHSGVQEIYITSQPSETRNTNDLNIHLNKIIIGDFTPIFIKSNRLEGALTGDITLSDPLGKMELDVEAILESFRLDDDSIGTIKLNTNYSPQRGQVRFNALSTNERYPFELKGSYNNLDSSINKQILDIETSLNQTHIDLIKRYLSGIFSKMDGVATGKLRIVGSPKNLKYLGTIDLAQGGMLVDYTKVYYRIPKAKIVLADGEIDFGSFTITDTLNQTGTLLNGKLYHQGFDNMVFDFRVKTDKLLLLNTKASDNSIFYGKVIGKASLSFTGPMEDMLMDIKGEPTDSSKLYLPLTSSKENEDADFIVWKVYGKEMQVAKKTSKESNLSVAVDITANPFAKVLLIMDELTGDIVEATGRGNLKMKVGTKEEMTLNGRYEIEDGVYNFSFQNWRKQFIIKKGSGNSISWNGDPMQANLNIEAVYEAKNVKFGDLTGNNASQFGDINDNVKKFRGKVLVVAKITERLLEPKISFRIDLPDNSPVRNEPGVAALFQLIERDENELNKQVSFLILFNSFSPINTGRTSGSTGNIANTAFEGLVVNSISGFLSTMLTKEMTGILRKAFKDESLQVNFDASLYNGASLITNTGGNSANVQTVLPDRTTVNFSVSKNFFNERLTFIVGSAFDFGLSSQQSQAAFQFLPDVTAEYKLTPDGKFLLTFFYRNNYSYISNSPLSRSGASISYRREFDRFRDIFGRKKSTNQTPNK